jgi:branched-chain amino acid aminotransferase
MWTFINNEYVPAQNARISVTDLSVQRGYGVFDFFRTHQGRALYIEDHLLRLEKSASVLRLPLPYSRDQIKEIVINLIQKNSFFSSGIRITITGGSSHDSYSISDPVVIITEQNLEMVEVMHKGLKLITYQHQRELPTVKSINYLTGVWLQDLIHRSGADDVLYINNGFALELPRSNYFIVSQDGVLVTPSLNILEGVTRKRILTIASERMPVECRPISVDELFTAAEMFVSSTTKRISPVVEINGHKIGNGKPGRVTKELFQVLIKDEDASS